MSSIRVLLGIVLGVAVLSAEGCKPQEDSSDQSASNPPAANQDTIEEATVVPQPPSKPLPQPLPQPVQELARKEYPTLFVGEIRFQRRNFLKRYNSASLADTRRAMTGMFPAVIDYVRQQVKATEFNPEKQITNLWMLAELLISRGKFEESIKEFASCMEMATMDPTLAPAGMRDRMITTLAVAHLRNGETQWCMSDPRPEGCVFPLSENGRHPDPKEAERAIEFFEQFLAKHPEDYEIRWLLNLSYMAIGRYPQDVPASYLIPKEVFESTEEVKPYRNVANALGVDSFDAAGGAIIEDFDGDGYLDIFTTTMEHYNHAKLYRNRGDGTFQDRSDEAGLAEQTGGLNVVHADYDNDGDYDVYILRGGWGTPEPNSLLRNRGDGTFEDVTVQAGLRVKPAPTQTAVWIDIENDGDLDLYLGSEFNRDQRTPNQLFVNKGDGSFTEQADLRGVSNDYFCKGVTAGDFDNDGDSDIYVSNFGAPNRLYRNDGNGYFNDIASQVGLQDSAETFATWFWDFDNDGWLDIFVAGYHLDMEDSIRSYLGFDNRGEKLRLYKNIQGKRFTNVAEQAKLTRAYLPMGANFGDIDNDGFLDFMLGTGEPSLHALIPNVAFKNVDGLYFADITSSGRFGNLHKGHAIAFGDIDHDGDQDIYWQLGGMMGSDRFYNALYENPGNDNHWITLKLIGRTTNRNAIGARVTVTTINESGQNRTIHRNLSSGGSFGGNTFRLEIGLGDAQRIDSIDVWWPTSNSHQLFHEVPMDRMFRIEEGQDQLIDLNSKPIRLNSGSPDTN